MLNEHEREFIELVLEAGSTALDQDTFQFMREEGFPIEEFDKLYTHNDIDEVVQSLQAKNLVYTETQNEIIRYTDFPDGEVTANWEHTVFKTVDRRYIYFTEELEALYRNQ